MEIVEYSGYKNRKKEYAEWKSLSRVNLEKEGGGVNQNEREYGYGIQI